MRAWSVLLVLPSVLLIGCEKPSRRHLDLDLVRITGEGKLRTDVVGDAVQETATFVLVDAENTAKEGAYVTLAGDLADASGTPVGAFKAQSLWIPAGERRTFALVDRERKPRPTAARATIRVRSATIPDQPPPARVDQLRELPDNGDLVVQGILHNDAARRGEIMVIASFHGSDGRPMTRPFSLVMVPAGAARAVQFVSPPGAAHGTIYVGDVSY
ncbi:MAG: hypothetical protein ABI467_12685 [Kofleriaceae bacterium]